MGNLYYIQLKSRMIRIHIHVQKLCVHQRPNHQSTILVKRIDIMKASLDYLFEFYKKNSGRKLRNVHPMFCVSITVFVCFFYSIPHPSQIPPSSNLHYDMHRHKQEWIFVSNKVWLKFLLTVQNPWYEK